MAGVAAGALLLVLTASPGGEAAGEAPAAPAASPARPPSSWVAALQLDRLSAGSGGGGATLDWVRPTAGRFLYLAGLSAFRLDDTRWSYGKLGAVVRPAPRHSFDGEARLGRGDNRERDFDYRLAEVGYTREVLAKRLYLRLGDQYLDVDRAAGNLLKTTLRWLPTTRWSGELTWVRSTGGNLDVETATLRIDRGGRRLRFLVGGSTGRSAPELFNFVAGGGSGDLKQAFAGIVLPGRRYEWTLVLDHLEIDSTRRDTLTLAVKIPGRAGGGER